MKEIETLIKTGFKNGFMTGFGVMLGVILAQMVCLGLIIITIGTILYFIFK